MEWQGQIPLLKPLGFNDSKTNINWSYRVSGVSIFNHERKSTKIS